MTTTDIRVECGRSDCRQPATTRVASHSQSGRTWAADSCAEHIDDTKTAMTALGFTIAPTHDPGRVFTDAANHLQTHGWHQGGFYPGWVDTLDAPNRWESGDLINERGYPACSIGALAACGGGHEEILVLAKVITNGATVPSAENAVVEWNDHPGRTVDEILDALHRAAKAVA